MIEQPAYASTSLQLAEIGFNQQMLPVFLGLMVAAGIAWLFLSRRLYGLLQNDYPGIYESLGQPKLVMKKSFATNYRVAIFLFRHEYESTDNNVIRLCQGLRYIFLIYVICFMGSCFLLMDAII